MVQINPDQSSSKAKGQKVENDPFNIDLKEIKSSSLGKEQQPEGTTITTITAPIISITKYSVLPIFFIRR